MRFHEAAILWLHILLPAISLILLPPTAVLALAKAQQQQAKVLSNFINLKSRAALAAARAKHPEFYSRLSNRVGKLNGFRNQRTKRQAEFEPRNPATMMDGTPNFVAESQQAFQNQAATISQGQLEQPQTLMQPHHDTPINTQINDVDQKEEVRVGSPDQQEEALNQLQNMWNMNSFPQANGDIIRSSEPGVVESPEPHFLEHTPKTHSKAISLVKDKKGGTVFSFSSYDQWRNAHDNGENGQGGMVQEMEPKKAINDETRKWMKQKNEEAKFDAAINQLFNARHPHNKTIDDIDTNLGPIFTVPPPTSSTMKPTTTTLSASDLWNIEQTKQEEESRKLFDAIQTVINTPPRKYQYNITNDPSISKAEKEAYAKRLNTTVAEGTVQEGTQAKPLNTTVTDGIVQEGTPNVVLESQNHEIGDQIIELLPRENTDPNNDIFREIQEHHMRREFEQKMLNFTKGIGIRPRPQMQQNPIDLPIPSQSMNPEARTFDLMDSNDSYEDGYGSDSGSDFDKKMYKIFEKKVKLLKKKLKIKDKDDHHYPENYYSTHSGYEHGGYYRNAEENEEFDENPAETVMLSRELEEENRNFPGHDPNHPGHIDGRCAENDDKLYKIYKKKLEKLYKKLNKKKPDSAPVQPVVYPIYQQHDDYGQYGNEQYGDGHYANEGYNDAYGGGSGYYDYNRNAAKDDKQKKSKKQKSAVENSTQSDTTLAQKSSVPDLHHFAREIEETEDSFSEDPKTRHFKGSFSHGHSIQFNKGFGLAPVVPTPVQINLNANSFANSGASANAASFQQQQLSSSAKSFASSGSQQNFNQQAGGFGSATGGSIQVQPTFVNQQSTASANSFANSGSQQPAFLNQQQSNTNDFSNSHGAGFQFSSQTAPVWENRPVPHNFQNGWSGGQSGDVQQGFSQGGSAQSSAQSSSNNLQHGFSNGAQSSGNQFVQGFNQGVSGSSAQSFAKAESSSFSQSPVTFGLNGNAQNFASASASASAGGAPWVGEEAPIPVEEFMNDGESLTPVNKIARQTQNPGGDFKFITNIVDQSLKLGNQAGQKEFSDDSIKEITGIVEESVSADSSNTMSNIPSERESSQVKSNSDLEEKKKNVFDTMNFVTGIVDFGINEHEKHKPRSSESAGNPLTNLLTGGLRLRRQAESLMDQNPQLMNFPNFENIRRDLDMMMRESQQRPNFFINQDLQNQPQQNFMSQTIPQMQQRSHFPEMLEQPSNHQTSQKHRETNFNAHSHKKEYENFEKPQQEVIKAFTNINDQATKLAENITQHKAMENIPKTKVDLDLKQLDTVKHEIKKAQKEMVGAFNDTNNQALQKIQANKEKGPKKKQKTFDTEKSSENKVKEKDSVSDEIITAPLPKHLRDDDNDDDSSEEKMKTERPQRTTTQPIPTTEKIASISINQTDTKNAMDSKSAMSEILHKTGVSEILKSIDEELNMLTPAQRQEFVKQELELLTDMVMESLKKDGNAQMPHDIASPNIIPPQTQDNQVTLKSSNAKDPIVSRPYLFQAPNDPLARESFYNRPEYRSVQNEVDDSRLGIQHLEDNFDSILGMHQDTVQDLKRVAQDDNDLLMISWIGEGLVKDLQDRRDKSTNRTKREAPILKSDPLSVTNLVSDPNAKIDVTKTLDNLGAVTRHVLENTKAPMYHVRSMIGNAKNSVMAAVKAAPNNLIIPSKYEIANVDKDSKLGSINRRLLKEKIRNFAEEKKNKKADGFGITDTFTKLGSILKESVDSGKQSVAHANDLAMNARNAYYTARHSVPRIVTPDLPGARKVSGKPLPKKAVLLAPRILDVTQDNNVLGNSEPETENPFVGLGQILDSVGLTYPNKNDIEIEKIVLPPETVSILRNLNKGRPKEIRSSTAIKDWLKDSLKADQQTVEDRDNIKQNLLGNSIDATLESLEDTEKAFGVKSMTELFKNMRLQMKEAVKEQLDFANRRRQKMRKARILKKYKGIPVRGESGVKINNVPNNAVPNIMSRMNDLSNPSDKIVAENIVGAALSVQEPATNVIPIQDIPISTTMPPTTTEKLLSQSSDIPTIQNHMQHSFKSPQNHLNNDATTEAPEDPNQKLGLYLTPDLMKPFMGRASSNELNQFWRENNDFENIRPNKNIDIATNQISQSTVSTLPLLFPQITTAKSPIIAQKHQEFDSQALTQMLGAVNPIMFEKFFNERMASSLKGNRDQKVDSNIVNTPKHLEPQRPELNGMTTKNQDTLAALSQTGVQSMKDENKETSVTANNFSPVVEGAQFGKQFGEATTENLNQVEANKESFHKFEIRMPERETVIYSSDNSEDNEKARFHMVPEGGLYKKPFMGTLDKKLIKKFLKQYNDVPDSSSEEGYDKTPYKKDIYSSIGYENEVY